MKPTIKKSKTAIVSGRVDKTYLKALKRRNVNVSKLIADTIEDVAKQIMTDEANEHGPIVNI